MLGTFVQIFSILFLLFATCVENSTLRFSYFVSSFHSDNMNSLFTLLIIFVALSLASAIESTCDCKKKCPPCNTKAGCRIWGCPCTHDGFTMHPGYEPLNPPRPAVCPECVSKCDNFAIKCATPFRPCTDEQLDTYRGDIEPIEDVVTYG